MSHSTTPIRLRRRTLQYARPPTHFFIGRLRDPPYAWSYDDDEMRPTNIMWLIEEVVDGAKLERIYLEETNLLWSIARNSRKRGGKRRKGLDGGIIDLSISNGEESDSTLIMCLGSESRSKLPASSARSKRSLESLSNFSVGSSSSTMRSTSDCTPTKNRFEVAKIKEERPPKLRAVFSVKSHDKLIQYVTGKSTQ